MQNRYFGDVGDYGKYGLLRKLCGLTSDGSQLSLGVVWYLVPDEGHNDDGKHVSYLRKLSYRSCDPYLFDGLKLLLNNGPRSVSKIQQSDLLPNETVFFDTFLSYDGMPITGSKNKLARLMRRRKWLLDATDSVENCDIIFLDPDNGFQVKSVKQHADRGVKYIFWDEVKQFSNEAKTLVIYHHLNRTMKSRDQIMAKLDEFRNKLPRGETVIALLFKRGSHRVFFIVPSNIHRSLISTRLRNMGTSNWAPHIELFGL
jgi:hypothetical protein